MAEVFILGIQLIGIFFAFLMLYVTFINYKKKDFTSREWISWSAIWIIFLILIIFPYLLEPIVSKLHFARALDFFVCIGIMLFGGIVFRTYTLVRINQKKVEQLVRDLAYLIKRMEEIERNKN